MVHDGDQNKAGGDAGQASFTYYYPGPPNTGASLSGYVTGTGGTPLNNVQVTLTGTDELGVAVSLTVSTNAQGFYDFTGLKGGTYTIARPSPSGYTLNQSTPGLVNSTVDGTVQLNGDISMISIADRDQGTDYDFSSILIVG
jgi:hypothetical protein